MDGPPDCSFSVVLDDDGMIPIGIDPRAIFGRARPPVIVTIGGYSYRSTVAIMRGITFVPLRRSHREAIGVARGDTIMVTLTLDVAPREVDAPEDLSAAIGDAGLERAWERWSYTRRREAAEAVASARRPDTRARRIAAVIDGLRANV